MSEIVRRPGIAERFRGAVAPEGPIARAMLVVHHVVVTSALFFVCALPFLAVRVLVGGEASHAGVFLSVAALAPLWPAWAATLLSMSAFMEHRGYPGQSFMRFWRAWADSLRLRSGVVVAAEAIALVLAYDLALNGDASYVRVAAASAVLWCIVTATFLTSSGDGSLRTVLAAARGLARRPWIAAAWLLAVVLVVLPGAVPVIGPTLLIVTPAVAAGVIVVVFRVERS